MSVICDVCGRQIGHPREVGSCWRGTGENVTEGRVECYQRGFVREKARADALQVELHTAKNLVFSLWELGDAAHEVGPTEAWVQVWLKVTATIPKEWDGA